MNENTFLALLFTGLFLYLGWDAWLHTQRTLANPHACSCMYCQPEKP